MYNLNNNNNKNPNVYVNIILYNQIVVLIIKSYFVVAFTHYSDDSDVQRITMVTH